ncbi:MAG: hypothetical protein M0C28_36810 [Candidatus Moduliflexus flocculans]|nr:hypothetical protein [Candidatus Moduliflexus flocculans]
MQVQEFAIFDTSTLPSTSLRFTILRMDIEFEYNKALDYLYSFVDYSLKHSSELAKAEFNLDRMFALMEELGNPQNTYPIIHVAGTKGKGSRQRVVRGRVEGGGLQGRFVHVPASIGLLSSGSRSTVSRSRMS